MNTFDFGDRLEREYFIEQTLHAGWRKDSRRCDTYATTYIHKDYPAYHIVVKVGALSADLYCDNKLLTYKEKDNDKESRLVAA